MFLPYQQKQNIKKTKPLTSYVSGFNNLIKFCVLKILMNEYIMCMKSRIPNVRSHEKMKHTITMEKFYRWKRNHHKPSYKKDNEPATEDIEVNEYIPKGKILELINEKETFGYDSYMESLQSLKDE